MRRVLAVKGESCSRPIRSNAHQHRTRRTQYLQAVRQRSFFRSVHGIEKYGCRPERVTLARRVARDASAGARKKGYTQDYLTSKTAIQILCAFAIERSRGAFCGNNFPEQFTAILQLNATASRRCLKRLTRLWRCPRWLPSCCFAFPSGIGHVQPSTSQPE